MVFEKEVGLKGSHTQIKDSTTFNDFLFPVLCFRIHLKAICFCGKSDFVSLLNTPYCLFLIPRVWAKWGRGSEIQITVFLPFLAFWLRDVRGEEVLVANVWFVECVGIVCLFLFLATALILPHMTTLCPVWAGQRKTQQTFAEQFDCA